MTEQSPCPPATAVLQADGATCATLTPLIRAKIRELERGDVLEVRTDDPSSHDGIVAWSCLTGNELLAEFKDGERTRFYLRKK